MSEPIDREVAVFAVARRLPAEERAAYLEEACAGDLALRQSVEQLLRTDDDSGPFLQGAATGAHWVAEVIGSANPLPNRAGEQKPGDRIGRYKLLEKLGEGGCGVVYVAEQTEPVRRRVALKVIKLGMDTKAVVARFETERQALALMDHPNIARVLDAGATEAGRPYFVMELVRGVKITDYCDQNNLPTRKRLDLFIQICHAIQHAHQKGVIHRDIKPSNILVTRQDGVPVPKVIDFGVAKATEGRLTAATVYTQLHQLIGTPAYMSPEQAEISSVDVDTRSDIYSLGVLLYELLTGRTPFDPSKLISGGIDAMRRTIRETEPLRPSTRLATLDLDELTTAAKRRATDAPRLISSLKGDLDWVVMKCLEKDRARRYATSNGLAADLQRHLNEEPVVARPASQVYRMRKWVHRNKFFFAAASAMMLTLVLGLGVSTAMFLRERTARQKLVLAEREQAIERAEVAATGGDFDAMERALEEAERHGVSDAQLLMLRGLYKHFTGHSRDAVEPLQQAVQLMPQSVAARALLASAARQYDGQRYEEQLGLLLPLQPVTWEDYLFKGDAISIRDPLSELALMDKAVELKRNSPLGRLVRAGARADQAMSTHDLTMMQSALDDLEAARQFVPRDNFMLISGFAYAHIQAAQLCEETGRTEEQKQHLQKAEEWGKRLEQLSECELALSDRAVLLETSGREAEAFDYIQKILPGHHDPQILLVYGDGLYRRGRVQEANDVYARIEQANPSFGYIMRPVARLELSGGGERAKAELDRFWARNSGGPFELIAPDMYRLAGLKDEANRRGQTNYDHLPQRVSFYPFFAAHYLNLARFEAGLLDEAALIEASRDSGRKLVVVYTSVGILHLAEGDRAGAKEFFHKSMQTSMYGVSTRRLAQNLLARLELDPTWPPWIPPKDSAVTNQYNTSK